jgi:hypothetical protein
LATTQTGRLEGSAETAFDLARSIVVWQKGMLHLTTQTQTRLALPEGREEFPMTGNLTIKFQARLLSVTASPQVGGD